MQSNTARINPVATFALAAAIQSLHAQSAVDLVDLVRVTDSVYAALKPAAERFNDSNAGIIVTEDDVIVVDTQVTPAATRAVLAEIKKISNKPVRYVIATHWHGDHVQGFQVYKSTFPGVEFVGHETAREDVDARGRPSLEEELAGWSKEIVAADERLSKRVDREGKPLESARLDEARARLERGKQHAAELASIGLMAPTLTFNQGMELRRGERLVRLLHFRGHTRGDVVVYLPRQKVLFTGDLVDDLPYLGHGYPTDYLKTLKALAALDFEQMVPGHGAIRRGKDYLLRLHAGFESLMAQVQEAVRKGLTLEAIQKQVKVDALRTLLVTDELAKRTFETFIPTAVERTYQELTGKLK